jgi:membrane protease YdiL (CAAX protease family)
MMIPDAVAESPDAAVAGWEGTDAAVRRRARVKVVVFLMLMAAFSAVVEVLLVYVPFGTRLGLLTWTASWAFMLLMWSVGFAGLITLAAVDRSWQDIGFKSASRRYWLLAIALPVISCAAVYVPSWFFGSWVLGLGGFAGVSRLGSAVLSAGLHFPLYLFAATGEELGWRGVLVPNLARFADARVVAFLPGAIWALWHYPNMLLLGTLGTPLLFALICFSLMVIGHGVFLSWLRLASGSVWPAAVFHGAHNALVYGVFDRVTEPGALTAYITTEYGIGLSLAGAVIAYLFSPRLLSSRFGASLRGQRK